MGKFLQSNGRKIHYMEWPRPGSPVVILLHGQSGFWYDWNEVAPLLAQDYHVYAIDHPGFGDSDWDPTARAYQVEGFASDMTEVCAALGVHRFLLVGHSFGGRIGLAYACAHPEQVRAVVLADSSPDVDPAGSLEARRYLSSIPPSFASLEEATPFFRVHYTNLSSSELAERLRHYLAPMPDGRLRVKRDPAIGEKYRQILAGQASGPQPDWRTLASVPCPVLLLRGTRSELVTPAIEAQMRQVQPRMETVEIPDATHLIATEKPALVLAALRDYLARLPA